MSFFDIFKIEKFKIEISALKSNIKNLEKRIADLHAEDYETVKKNIEKEKKSFGEQKSKAQKDIQELNIKIEQSHNRLINDATDLRLLMRESEAQQKKLVSSEKKIDKLVKISNSISYAIDNFPKNNAIDSTALKASQNEAVELVPTIMLNLPHLSMRELRKAFNDNNRLIDELYKTYADNYTTKANKAIYSLMTIALRAELQNVIYNLKFDKLDNSINSIQEICNKYLEIASEGNQSIKPTLQKFVGQLEYYFINAVKIEYTYYVRKEQAKQEQAEIRERMRQEAAERKALAEERKKIEAEELKFKNEIEKINNELNSSNDQEEIKLLQAKILELQAQMSNVITQKEKVIKLQNGLAGTVYVISNIGSFGENVFKIGMTRRQEPLDRIRELGDASVPFPFDVHSLIFSDKASELETALHKRLKDRRVNKVNIRKEFFNISLDELEQIVYEINPTAGFNRTMLAEQYKQSQSTELEYLDDVEEAYEDENEDESDDI